MNFKTKIGLFFIISHFALILLVFCCKVLGGYTFEELTTLIFLLLPMFAIYTTTVLKDIIANSKSLDIENTKYNSTFKFVTVFICVLFILFLFSIVILKAFNYAFEDFEQLKLTLALVETIFGAYVGQILFSIYKPTKTSQKKVTKVQ